MNDYKIKELYEEMELELIASMKRNLKRHLNEEKKVGFEFTQWQAEKLKELKRYQRENAKIIGRRTKGLNKKVSEHLQRELKKGSLSALKQYNKLHKDKLNANKLLSKSFFQTNDRKVNNLIKVVNNDLNIVNASALRMTNDQYREVIHKSAFFNANGVMTEKQAVDMANKDFLSRGLNCIEYKDGRRVNIASYSQMAVRTASLRAHLMGEGDFRKEIGNPLVIVTTHGTACKLCTAWQGKVLIDDVYSGGTQEDGNYTLLSEAMKQGFLHPNCRHGLATYYPELEGIKYDEEETDEEIDDALRDKLNYYDRQEKRFNRMKIGSLEYNNICEYKNREKYFENERISEIYASDKIIRDESFDVNWKNIKSDEFKNKVMTITNNSKLNEEIYDSIIKMLEHRDGTNGEDLIYFDYKAKKLIGKQTNMKTSRNSLPTPTMKKALLNSNNNIIAIHNHPTSNPPSDFDLNSCSKNKYRFGITVGHNGEITLYRTGKKYTRIDSDLYNGTIAKYKKMHYNEYTAQKKALEQFKMMNDFSIEVK